MKNYVTEINCKKNNLRPNKFIESKKEKKIKKNKIKNRIKIYSNWISWKKTAKILKNNHKKDPESSSI